MEKNLMWYKDKRIENLSEILMDKEYEVIKTDSIKEAKSRILSLLAKDKKIALGDTWELNDEEFIKELEKFDFYNFFTCDKEKREEVRRESLLADIALLEGEFITQNGQVVVVGDYNTSSTLFGAKKIIILLSEKKIIKNLDAAFKRVDDLEKYYRMRSEKMGNSCDGLSIGVIENARKFPGRITLVISRDSEE